MAYLSPEQITGQVLLNMHVNDKSQLVTSSNLDINLEFDEISTRISDGGKIYSKYIWGESIIKLPSLDKLMNNVTEFTIAFWLNTTYSPYFFYINFLDGYISISVDKTTKKITANINFGDKINLTSFDDGGDPWKYIAITLHNRKFAFYINGIKQVDAAYQEYESRKWAEVCNTRNMYIDDICLILNQAVWTDNFTPPKEPLLGDLKYKTELWPENTIITDHSDLMVKLY